MSFNGSGTYNRVMNWTTDRNDGLTIQASRMDTEADDIATALSLCLLKDGQQTPTANIPMGGFKLTNVGDATNATDAMNRQTGDARYPLKIGTSTDNAIARYDGVAGQVQDSLIIIDDTTGAMHPATHDVGALGTTALRWSDAFFASGAVISFGAASTDDVTITHGLNTLAFAGASSGYSFDAGVTISSGVLAVGAGSITTAGAFALTLTQTGASNVTLPTTGTLATLAGAETLSSKVLTAPDINGGTADSLTSLSVRSTGAAFDVSIGVTEVLTANRALTLKLNDAARTVDLSGNLTLGGALTTAAAFSTAGAFGLTLTATALTNVTLPTAGTLAILGANTFTADQTITSTDAGATAGPTLDLYRDSASPAASDNIGQLTFSGRDSASNKQEYAAINLFIADPTSASEDSVLGVKTNVAGVYDTRLKIGAGLYTLNATGGDKGVDTCNVVDYYRNGISQTRLYKSITSDATGSNVNTAQPWFPTAGALTLAANKTYRVEGLIYLFRAAGTTSHTTRFLFGGTATVSSILVHVEANNGDTATSDTLNRTIIVATSGAVVKGASTSATEVVTMRVSGIVRVTTGGTLIPQFQYSAAPGGAPTIQSGSFFEVFEIGADTDATVGTWA